LTIIDSVNKCLRYIGESKIPSGVTIDSLDEFHEAVQIRDIINEQSRELQTQGWWFNKESWVFIPDATSGKIAVPDTVLAITGSSIALRGNNIYDISNKTLVFTEDVTATTTFEQDFEQCPETFSKYVTYEAAREAQALFKGDSTVDKDLERLLTRAFVKLEKEHMSNKSYNLITVSRMIDRGSNPTALA